MQNNNKDRQLKKLLPLRNFAVLGQYKASYLSILVQRKKLKAKKVGRNYYTSKEWFDEYLEKHGSVKKLEKNKEISAKAKSLPEEINLDELSNKIAGRIISLTSNQSAPVPVSSKVNEIRKKKKNLARNFLKKITPKNLKLRLASAFILLFFISYSLAFYAPISSFYLGNLMKGIYLFPQARLSTLIVKYVYGYNPKSETLVKDIISYPSKGRVAGISEANYNLFLINEESLTRERKKAIEFFQNKFKKSYFSISDNIGKLYTMYFNFSNQDNKELVENEKMDAEENVRSQGAVVVPFRDGDNAQEIKQKIEQMFSDNVVIEPNETDRSGIVSPVFGSETSEQKYLYMMVPVTEE